MKNQIETLCKLNKRLAGKIIIMVTVFAMALLFSGCEGTEKRAGADFNLPKEESSSETQKYLYYVTNDDSAIVPVPFDVPEIEPIGVDDEQVYYEKLVRSWLDALSGVPENIDYKSPIDADMGVKNITYLSGQLTLDFATAYLQTESLAEVLRRAAVVQTLVQIDGVNGVAFTVDGEPLTDSKQLPIGVMTADTFVSNPGAEINSYETTTIQVYFADSEGEYLIGRTENVGYISNISMERLVVDRVIAGPLNDKSYPTVAPTLKVLNVTTKDGICYVNFDNSFLTKTQKVSDEVVIYSFVNSLTELPNVSKVQFMVDSESEVSFGEHIYLSEPFERNLELVMAKE